MFNISMAYTDYKGKARRENVSFNLDGREVFRMLPELKKVFDWMESNREAEPRELTTEEVSEFYTDFENILLEAYGEVSEDGRRFSKTNKYLFEESALFNACMIYFVTKPDETGKMLEKLMPQDLFEMVKNATPEQIAASTESKLAEQAAEIERLRKIAGETTDDTIKPDIVAQ